MKNIHDNDSAAPEPCEVFDTLIESNGLRLERIRSYGHPTPDGEWYDQPGPEWVMVTRGRAVLEFTDGRRETMIPGDYIEIPAGCRHRVAEVSDDCVWLALHYGLQAAL